MCVTVDLTLVSEFNRIDNNLSIQLMPLHIIISTSPVKMHSLNSFLPGFSWFDTAHFVYRKKFSLKTLDKNGTKKSAPVMLFPIYVIMTVTRSLERNGIISRMRMSSGQLFQQQFPRQLNIF